ncbi:MAG: hypothetical protein FJX25_05480 [Alphaproteobacteria bacterium]|nr:hypothetical protein [Alphaproteobacteria bacterium]
MAHLVIAMGATPHMKLSCSGHEFTAVDALMAFGSHVAAHGYLVQHTGNGPLKDVWGEILEDLSL